MSFIDDAFKRVLKKINDEQTEEELAMGVQTHDEEGSLRSIEDILEDIGKVDKDDILQ